jgi:putative spermidine/putrescine transport system permease protein
MRLGTPGTLLLLAPAALMLLLVFAVPIGWFFWSVLSEEGSLSDVAGLFGLVLGSRAVVQALWTTAVISIVVTGVVALVGYPLAYAMTRARGLALVLLIAAVVLPYFTSVIVRTYSFMVLLGRNGLVNQALLGLGVVHEPLSLMYNRFGVTVGMSYVLLPYMVLTLYAVMRGIDPGLVRAAQGMGASGPEAFRRVFLPLTFQGLVTGCLMVFILAIGFFITPALMGGQRDTMIAMLIEREVEVTLNWPVAAVTSLVLLAATLILYALYCRFADLRRVLG